jgi:hypothetical protein
MYVGHIASGLLLAAVFPTVPTKAIILGVGWLDIVDGLFTLVGINHVRPDLSAGPYLFFELVFVDWDHSLLMALVLSVIWAALYSRDTKTALVAFVASFSHWLCDLPFHNLDLAAYPYSELHYGWGWWGRFLAGAWAMEGAFSAVCIALAWTIFASRGVSITAPAVVCALLFLNLSPWTSPLKFIAQMGHPADYLLHGALITAGFLVPGLLISGMIDKAVVKARGKGKIL